MLNHFRGPIGSILTWCCSMLVVASLCAQAETFRHLTYDDMVARIDKLASFSDLCRITVAQKEFGLPSPGVCGEQKTPCITQIIHITNFSTYEGDKTTRPEVYISGEVHGDERVGPHASLALAELLLTSDNPWIRYLVNTRSIFITPITNSIGFDRNTREENNVDTNRDYPIDQKPEKCMRAIASRIANELYRRHMFQLAITFHGGMEAIAMEWGTLSRVNANEHKSPDDVALVEIASGLSNFAGPISSNARNYPVGRMNDLVYPVEGGMEDWAYAGSWDPKSRRLPCNPSTFGGYDTSRTQYTDAQLRAVNILVETSNRKWPMELGTSDDILNPRSGTGHVPRNVRLALMVIDLVQPYVYVTQIRQSSEDTIELGWEVGGAFTVDQTWAVIDVRTKDGKVITTTSKQLQGMTRWATGAWADRNKYPFRKKFAACFKLPEEVLPRTADELVIDIRMFASVDSNWSNGKSRGTVSPKGFAPQSHFVNARTNPDWDKANEGYRVKGKIVFKSEVRSITMVQGERRRLRDDGRTNGGLPVQYTSAWASVARRILGSATPEDNDQVIDAGCTRVPSKVIDSNTDGASLYSNTTGVSILPIFVLGVLVFAAVYLCMSRRRAQHQMHQVLPEEEPAVSEENKQ